MGDKRILKEGDIVNIDVSAAKSSEAVAYTLKEMTKFAQPGMTTKELDNYGAKILSDFGGTYSNLRFSRMYLY